MNKTIGLLIFLMIAVVMAIIFIPKNDSASSENSQLTEFPTATPTPESAFLPPTPTPTVIVTETPSATPSAGVEKPANKAVIKTSKGNITLELYAKDAPNTVNNFIQKAKSGYYNNLTFHRVEDWVIQGGDPKGNGTGGGNMSTELNNKPFVTGSLGVARGGDIKISNDSQFFITKSDASWLNKQYTNFGMVTGGMDVVNKIAIGDKILGIDLE